MLQRAGNHCRASVMRVFLVFVILTRQHLQCSNAGPEWQPSSPWVSKVLRWLGFSWTSTFVPTGASGQLKSHAPHSCLCAESRGFVREPLSMLRVIVTCSNTLSHRQSGKLGFVPQKMVMN